MTAWMKKLVFVGVLASGMALAGCNSRNASNEQGTGGGGKQEGTFSGSGTTKKGETGSGLHSAPREPGVRERQGNPTPSRPDSTSPGSSGFGGTTPDNSGDLNKRETGTQLPEQTDSLKGRGGTSGMAQQPNTRPGTGSPVSGGQTPTSTGHSEAGVKDSHQDTRRDVLPPQNP